jgi:hypothetical protein
MSPVCTGISFQDLGTLLAAVALLMFPLQLLALVIWSVWLKPTLYAQLAKRRGHA